MSAIAAGSTIQRQIEGGICTLTFDRPESGANIFDAATMRDLATHLDAIEQEANLKGVIVTSAKKSIFIAGADLKTLLHQAQTGELRAFIAEGQRVFNRLAALKVPSVAAIHGACAGGGYEITLACDWRIASNDRSTRIGLPETTLGLVPAWGGATRLPRLIGPEAACEVILKGKLYPADEAQRIGMVDEIASRDELFELAKNKIAVGKRPAPLPPNIDKQMAAPPGGGNAAPRRGYDIISQALTSSTDESLQRELDAIVELGETDATQNLIRNFFLAEKYKKGSGTSQSDKAVHAAVIGAGVMGSGIAQWLSARGVTVILRDVTREFVDRGLASIDKVYADAVKRGIMTEAAATEGRARIIASTAHTELRDIQIVIEAASEKIEIKKEIFRQLATEAPKALLATNTSALSISELAEVTDVPERVVGLHFFNPVSRMKLIEVVIGKKTAEETRERALTFARQIGKVPVLVQDRPGFLVNRVLFPYLLDAAELFEAGLDAPTIDNALLAWGMPMGPLRLIDEIGMDVTIDIGKTLADAYGRRNHAASVLRWLRDGKMLGRKTGAGFYQYEGRKQTPNEALSRWRDGLHDNPEDQGGAQRRPGQEREPKLALNVEELTNRLVLLMVNEAARCLEEKVVASPEDADYGMLLGTGFPAYRGGPLRFAQHFGLKRVVSELERFARTDDKFTPCDLLQQHARSGTSIYES